MNPKETLLQRSMRYLVHGGISVTSLAILVVFTKFAIDKHDNGDTLGLAIQLVAVIGVGTLIINYIAAEMEWSLLSKRREIERYFRFMRENQFPRRVYKQDDSGTYLLRIIDLHSEYGRDEISPQTVESAKVLYRESYSSFKKRDALDIALEKHSPKSEAPPVCYVHHWLNEASEEEIKECAGNLVWSNPELVSAILEKRPFTRLNDLFDLLKHHRCTNFLTTLIMKCHKKEIEGARTSK